MTQPTKLQAAVDTLSRELGLTYTAVFVPFSRSRNAKKATRPGDYSLNWRVTIARAGRSLTVDYSQGIAHIPGYQHAQRWDELQRTCESGRYGGRYGSVIRYGQKPLPAPLLRDVLYSLALDAEVLDAGTFEEWAGTFGYDVDSRAAEGIYKQCLQIALELRAMIGDSGLVALRVASEDY